MLSNWLKFLTFTYVCLPKEEAVPGVSLTARVKQNVASFIAGRPTVSARRSNKRKPKTDDVKRANLVCEKIDEGNLKAAIQTLLSEDSLAPANHETLSLLKEKHPPRLQPITQTSAAHPSFKCTPQEVLRAVKTFPVRSSGGYRRPPS